MTESLSQTIKRAYRDIHSSPGRTALAALVLIVLLALLVLGIQFIVRQRGSLALLNWLNLLLIPLLLVAAAVWLAGTWKRTQLEMARLRDERALVESYYDRLTDLLLSRNLRGAAADDEVARAARAHTLTTLRQLDGEGRGQIVRFLYESSLLSAEHPAVDLQAADLSGANLAGVHMAGVGLRNVNLRDARLVEAEMPASDLRQSQLERADLSRVELAESYLRGAHSPVYRL